MRFPIRHVWVIQRIAPARVKWWDVHYWMAIGDGTYLMRVQMVFN